MVVVIATGLIIYVVKKTIRHTVHHAKKGSRAGGCNGDPLAQEGSDQDVVVCEGAGASHRKGVPDSVYKLMKQLQQKQKARAAERGGRGEAKSCKKGRAQGADSVVSIGWSSVDGARTEEGRADLPIGAIVTDEIAWSGVPGSPSDWWKAPLREYKQRSLRWATQNFTAQIGVGGYSDVYHGMMPNGMQVAVKVTVEKPSSNPRSDDHFNRWLSELRLARQCEHKHVVKVLGYSYQKKRLSKPVSNPFRRRGPKTHSKVDLSEAASPFKGMQVLEFMEKGDLSAVLDSHDCVLDWSTRFGVLVGAARGLAFIHSQGIVHRDIKPANIFLDHEFCPKIGDFGISKSLSHFSSGSPSSQSCSTPSGISSGTSSSELFTAGEDCDTNRGDCVPPAHDLTAAKGTIGYLDPDYLSTGILTLKSDVFSFGVTILNVVSGKKAFELADLEDDNQANTLLLECRVLDIIDARLGEMKTSQESLAQATNVIRIAFLCMQRSSVARPTMEQVVALLTGVRDFEPSSSHLLQCLWEEYTRLKHDFMKDINSMLDQKSDIFLTAQSSFLTIGPS